jgi:hypothetical protein
MRGSRIPCKPANSRLLCHQGSERAALATLEGRLAGSDANLLFMQHQLSSGHDQHAEQCHIAASMQDLPAP